MSDGGAVRDEAKMCDERNVDQNFQKILDTLISEEYDGFDESVGETWIYPDNLPCRPYQLTISEAALYQNTLVVLPTGLGKTFIAAVVMYNIYRWYPKGKVIFMAPTRPLVAQQIAACRRLMPFLENDMVELTRRIPRARRIVLWRSKRVFFATPHVVRCAIVGEGGASLDGFEFPYDAIKLIVVDEAHKATGRCGYKKVVQSIFMHNPYFRVLALSATTGRTSWEVAEVVRNLLISHLEVRSEQSADVMQYVHQTMETIVVPNPFNVSAANITNGLVAEMSSDLDFGHPKFEEARSCLLQHFETHPDTRAIIICEYRESVTHIYRLLLQHRPLLRPCCFVGEGGTTGSLQAKQQIQTMLDFRMGKSNILVATSIDEKGIDVCEVELIICFDISSSNQELDRTGRQRKGSVVMIVTEGREHQMLQEVLRQKDKTKLFQSKVVKDVLYRCAPRLVPPKYNPECLKTFIKPPSEEEEEQMAAKQLGPLPKATKDKNEKTIKGAVQKERQAFRQNFSSREKSDLFNFADPSGTPPSPLKMDDCTTAEWASVRNYELQIELQPVIGKLSKKTPPLMAPPPPSQPADHQLRTVNKQLQLFARLPQIEKQPQTTDQSIMELEKVALPPPAAANYFDFDSAAFLNLFSGEDEVLGPVNLNITKTCSGQKPQEQPKRFFGCSLKENMDLNNVMRTCEVRQSRLRKKSTKHKIFDDDEDEGDGEEMHKVTNDESTDFEEAIDFTHKQQTQQQVPPQKRLKRLRTQLKKKRRVGACSFIAEEAAVSGSDESGDEAEYTTDQYLHDTFITSSDGEEYSGELLQTQMQALNSPPQRHPGALKIPEYRTFDDHDQNHDS